MSELSELRNELADLRDFIENASLPLHWVDENGLIVWANQAELDTLGYAKEEYIGKPVSDFHADKETINDILNRLTNKETLQNYEARLKCKDGSVKSVLINSNVLFREGKFVHTRCFTRDITDIKTQQEKKDQLLRKLEIANKELNEFSYILSHDLKTPARAISNLVDLLMIDNSETLDEASLHNLRLIKSRALRMVQMMNTILTWTSAGNVNQEIEQIKTKDLIREIVAGFDPEEPVEIHIEDSTPDFFGYRGLVTQVFQNIIENAIQFNDKEQTIIRIGGTEKEDRFEFYVQDNGPGIAPEHESRIFRIFQTLQSKDLIESTGIGLAIVQKILQMYRGSIRVESVRGEYTRFIFSFEKKAV